MFNAEKTTNEIVAWIIDWFEKNGKGCNAVIGISGGKDSSVVAALCAKALGKESSSIKDSVIFSFRDIMM